MPKTEVIKHPVATISGDLKKSAWGAILESLATIVLGIFLIVWPDVVVKVVAYVIGAFFVIKGAYQVINYFVVKGQNDFFNNSLLAGVISLLIGLALFLIGEDIVNIFRVVVGVWVIYESLVRINTAIKLHAAGIDAWKYALILALMMLVLGVFITFSGNGLFNIIGWLMVLAGVIGIVGDVMFIQYIEKIAATIINKTTPEK